MKELIYVTGNKDKFQEGETILKKYGVKCVQQKLELMELQETDGEIIALDKARQAYRSLKNPILVNDAIWMIPALNNFPGAFMKYTNDCFTPEDWLRLMEGIEDRRIIIREIIVYKDEHYEKIFYQDDVGVFLHEPSGVDGQPSDKVVSFSDDMMSVAILRDRGNATNTNSSGASGYDLVGEWLQTIESPSTRNIA